MRITLGAGGIERKKARVQAEQMSDDNTKQMMLGSRMVTSAHGPAG